MLTILSEGRNLYGLEAGSVITIDARFKGVAELLAVAQSEISLPHTCIFYEVK